MPRRHIIISGTGRAGTTFLVQLLTELRLDTGFTDPWSGRFANCEAGMEWDLRHPDAPYIVKNPEICDHLDELLGGGEITVDHAIVPIRDLYSAAESRRDVARRSTLLAVNVPGGLWHTEDPEAQEAVLAERLHDLLFAIAKYDVPLTLLCFPRFVRDPGYLYKKIVLALPGLDRDAFLRAFQVVTRPELVHDFESEGTMRERSSALRRDERAADRVRRSEEENRLLKAELQSLSERGAELDKRLAAESAGRLMAETQWSEEVKRLHGEIAKRQDLIEAMRRTSTWRLRTAAKRLILRLRLRH
jgi:hypothetical protein